ncbi:UNVERIFIED_CONTAM: Long-chain-alcohol oxidase FAO4A [Sesamum angustifolium]|uniref:Long-chain-alcohol oxidase n=1 Tax=Sesamum angustifolium TaxID=2727405 RepID=A0AAW2MJD1_9LAMI
MKLRRMQKEGHEKSAYSSSGQMEALTALCDTLLPSLDVSSVDDDDSLTQFYQTSASMAATPLARGGVAAVDKDRYVCAMWRKSLSSNFPYFQRFSRVSHEEREQILLSWSDSRFSLLRILFKAVKIFTLLLFFTQVNEKDENVSWKAIGYCRPDLKTRKCGIKDIQQLGNEVAEEKKYLTEEEQFGPLHRGIIDLNQSRETALDKLQNLGFTVTLPDKKDTTIESLSASFIVKCDAVVVGSGSGGGVVAGVLAKAGYKVLVLEKGSYLARSRLSLLEGQAMDQMYLGHGILGTENMDVLVVAGSTVGGGSTINWSASIRTPPHVIEEWGGKYKLGLFGSKAYDKALDVVCQKMGVQMEFEHEGFNNMVLRKGCEKLGYPVQTIPRNASSDHYCGWCCLGCKDGGKKGVSETWLVDLVESGNGAVLPQCEAGVKETAIVESEVTVVACGAICTPPLLIRSGLKNPNIGKNLHLHPVVMGWGYFPDAPSSDAWPEAEKKSYEGAIMTAMSTVAANPEASGYGAIIQTPALHPGMFSALMPWLSGRDIKNRMRRFSRTAHIFALARDKGSGVITSPTDISYKMDDADQANLSNGIEKVLRILAAAGAEEIGTHHKNGRVLKVKLAEKEEFERFVKEESLRALGTLSSPICSAHQMGSCRMGVDPTCSAVRPTGETWEVEGLYIADASVFPTALGVNPMVTIQAIAYCIAQSVLEALGSKVLI